MSEAYERVRSGRLAFKGGELATRENAIDKKKKKKKTNKDKGKLPDDAVSAGDPSISVVESGFGAGDVYTIDAAKKMKYEELFPVETKKFGYDPNAKTKSVEEALDDRVKKKADRYFSYGGRFLVSGSQKLNNLLTTDSTPNTTSESEGLNLPYTNSSGEIEAPNTTACLNINTAKFLTFVGKSSTQYMYNTSKAVGADMKPKASIVS